MADGSLKCFTTEIEGDEIPSGPSAEEIIAASDKLFAQVKWLVERDQEKVFGTTGE
jgi:hypothetical protein